MAKVLGIGGIFFKSEDPEKLNQWYRNILGIPIETHGSASFTCNDLENDLSNGMTVWSLFEKDTDYFAPSRQNFMINYRVDDLVEFLAELGSKGIEQVGDVEEYDYGKFGWILDPEGNKIELWQPL